MLFRSGTYDKHRREFVIPGRRRIPLNERSIFRTMGLPSGDEPIVYAMDADIQARLGPILFPGESSTPSRTRLFQILKALDIFDERYKQLFVMYIMCTIICPTTKNKISNRCYPVLVSFTILCLLF